MGATACWNLLQATKRLSEVLACEFIVACQALEFNELQPSKTIVAMKQRIRSVVKPLEGDRSTSADIIAVADELLDGKWLARVEAEVGRLPR
jgi:histidine ammonia-lyase